MKKITSGIKFKNFFPQKKNLYLTNYLTKLINQPNEVINSLKKDYKDSYSSKEIKKFKSMELFNVIGMGGSSLGAHAIYSFLNKNIRKKFLFYKNLQSNFKNKKSKKAINLIISKSGNTDETIVNSNVLIQKKDKNIFITENSNNYLRALAAKLKSEIIDHNNYIGGRYSVLSEVGMLPAELMGLNPKNFRQLNSLIKNKVFLENLINNVSAIHKLYKRKKYNSIILNYDESSKDLFEWYRQLVAESLGKKGKGILPIISNVPKDNHSVMQLFLDGFKNNFFTFFFVKNSSSLRINNTSILTAKKYLKNKSLEQIIFAQKNATEKVFYTKQISFRSFEIIQKNEKSLGELFCFFILETILLGKLLKVNPYDQPSVELIKKETKKNLIF
ncbi:glucose-6-phosphate isomerase [Candidatus Pelagibacter sp.]|uniref:glucose-6-phosphate isomerase n=1 Tax=Candidatus Pelagibacter sp. TaxID=2024849 RepID=UPI003F858D56